MGKKKKIDLVDEVSTEEINEELQNDEEALKEAEAVDTVEEVSDEEIADAESESEEDDEEVSEEDEETEDSVDEDEEEPEGYDDYEDEETYRRRMRRKRRVKSQILAYSLVLVILILIGVGIFYLVQLLSGIFAEKAEEKQVAEQIEAMTETEEEVVIEAPTVEEPVEEEVVEEVDYLGEMVAAVMNQMTVEDKVAQLFIISPESLTGVDAATQAGDGTKEALNTYAVGGLVYSRKNIVDDEQLTTLISTTKEMSKYELFIAVKEDGGEKSTVAGSKLGDIPAVDNPKTLAENADPSQVYNAGSTIGSYLSSFGFNLNLAPTGDMTTVEGAINADISYGSEETVVSDMVAQMVEGLSNGNVMSCLTDFPGSGAVKESTADGRVECDIQADALTGQLVPYISGIAAGAKLVMINNVTYTAADDSGVPASLSKNIVTTYLRGNMGYEGIIISGPLNEKAITEYYTSGDAALLALVAGADMIYAPENFEEAYTAVLEAVKDGSIPDGRLNSSLERILRAKFADDVE